MRVIFVVFTALLATANASAAPPRIGVLVPGKSFGGLALGATRAQVRAAWGTRYGICRDCSRSTWYFTFRAFEPQGAGVAFRKGRAVALFTVWSPADWRTNRGVGVGDLEARVTAVYGPLLRVNCGTYSAMTLRRGKTTSAVYIVDGKVWGLGLSRSSEPVCR